MKLEIIFDSATNQNVDGRTDLADVYNSSDIYIPFETDFTERVFTNEYYNVVYIIKNIGGIHAFIAPVVGYIMMLFVFNFLFNLSNIFLGKNEAAYKNEFVKYLLFSK